MQGDAAARAVFLSPFSVAQALAMLLAAVAPGSASERQLLSVAFGLEPGGDAARALSSQLQELRRALVQAGGDAGNVTLCEADSAWLAPRYQLQPTFQKELEQAFGAKVAMLTGAQVRPVQPAGGRPGGRGQATTQAAALASGGRLGNCACCPW